MNSSSNRTTFQPPRRTNQPSHLPISSLTTSPSLSLITQSLIGYFVNTVAVRAVLEEDDTFESLVKRVSTSQVG